MLSQWWQRRQQARRERLLQQRAIPDDLWLATLAAHPFLKRRPLADLQRLRELSTLFLAQKEFSTAGDLVLTDAMAVAVAAQACVPVLHLPGDLAWYDSFVGIVLQPDEVQVERSWQDEAGVVHSGEETLAGEAMAGGPVMLSWRDVALDADTAADPDLAEAVRGYNVVIHEFAHVLDQRDGDATGMPPQPSRAAAHHWQQVLQAEHEALCAHLDRGEPTWLDPYAATGLEELFAVASEAFFVAPREFRAAHPALYRLLQGFYSQDPVRYG
jgi:MtfA peptidase